MHLIIEDHADPSVGIPSMTFTIETPICKDDDPDEIEAFRRMAIDLYLQFAAGRVTAMYEWDLDELNRQYYEAMCGLNGSL